MIEEALKHYTGYANFLKNIIKEEDEKEQETSNNFGDIYEMIALLTNDQIELRTPSVFGDIEILGSGSYGLVFGSGNYPRVVYKWFYEGFDITSSLDCLKVPYNYVGYNIKEVIPTHLKSNLINYLHLSDQGILMDRVEMFSLNDISTVREREEYFNKFLLYLFQFLEHGYFIADLTEYNMTFKASDGKPIMVDLDLLVHSDEIKNLFSSMLYYSDMRGLQLLCDCLLLRYSPKLLHTFKHLLETYRALKVKVPAVISSNPLL